MNNSPTLIANYRCNHTVLINDNNSNNNDNSND